MIKKKYRLYILALVLVGILLSSFHYHDDIYVADDCPVCIIQHILALADIPDIYAPQELIVYLLIPLMGVQTYLTSKLIRSCPSRAPPSFF